jgi:hypothetical protein
MKLSDIITERVVRDIAMRCVPDGIALLDVVKDIAENGAIACAAALGVTLEDDDGTTR